MYTAMSCFWTNGYIQHTDVCETFVDNGQSVTHQTRIKNKLSLQVRMLVIVKKLTNIKILGKTQQVRYQSRIKG